MTGLSSRGHLTRLRYGTKTLASLLGAYPKQNRVYLFTESSTCSFDREFKGHENWVTVFSLPPDLDRVNPYNYFQSLQFDDTKLMSGSMDSTIKIWDMRNRHCMVRLFTTNPRNLAKPPILSQNNADHSVGASKKSALCSV